MIQIYQKNNTNYEANGDIVLFPESCEMDAVLNGEWELELVHPLDEENRWKYIQTDNLIACPTFVSEKQFFRIYETIKTDENITAHARPVFFDCANKILLDVRPSKVNGQAALNKILSGTSFTAESNIVKASTAYYVRMNIMEAIAGDDENSFINRWGGERIYDNWKLIINDKIGADKGVRAEFGHNLASIEENVSYDSVITRIIPVAYNGYMLEGKTPWIDSPLINKYTNTYEQVVQFDDVKLTADASEDEESFGTLAALRKELIKRCNQMYKDGCDKPTVNYKVNLVQLSETEEYEGYEMLEKVSLGDTVHCKDVLLDIDVDARAIRIKYDCIEDKNGEIELGDFDGNYFSTLADVTNRMSGILNGSGQIKAEEIAGVINSMQTVLRAQRSIAQKQHVRAMLFEDLDASSPTYGAMSLGTKGLQIAETRTADGTDWDWTTAMTAKGLIANVIISGMIASKNFVKGKSGMMIDLDKGTLWSPGFQVNENGSALFRDGQINITGDVGRTTVWDGRVWLTAASGDAGYRASYQITDESGTTIIQGNRMNMHGPNGGETMMRVKDGVVYAKDFVKI